MIFFPEISEFQNFLKNSKKNFMESFEILKNSQKKPEFSR